MLLIAYLMSYTCLSQSDSTYCFTKEQVKVFLTAKVDLKECLKISSIIEAEAYILQEEKVALSEDLEAKSRKLKRSRSVSAYGILGTILFGFLAFLK